jgi:hypothetical protein
MDEGDLLDLLSSNGAFGKSTFLTVSNSEYLAWFHRISVNIRKNENVIHYAIYTPNDCVDVLSAYPPSVEWLN